MAITIDKLQYISQKPSNGSQLDAIQAVLEAGCKWIQLRAKNLDEDELLAIARQSRNLCEQYGAKLIVNDNPIVALRACAHGVHLGLTDMSVKDARLIVGQDMIVGGTANSFKDIEKRIADGTDYIGLGPYKFTTTKQNLSPLIGLSGYESIMEQVYNSGFTTPIIAIGGILAEDVRDLIKTGLYGIAISGGLTNQLETRKIISSIHQDLHYPIEQNS